MADDTGAPLFLPYMSPDGERRPETMYNAAMLILNAAWASATTLYDSLMAFWKMDEVSGSRLDAHGANDLTDNNTVTQVAGKILKAAQFTAANSEHLSIADNADLSMGNIDFTIAGWVYFDTVGAERPLFGKWDTVGQLEYLCRLESDNKLWLYVSNDGTASASVNTSGTHAASTWYFVAIFHDATANTINIQVNDGTVFSAAHTTGVFNGTSLFRFGKNQVSGAYHNGRLDEWGVWKRVLSAAERTDLYRLGIGRTYPFL